MLYEDIGEARLRELVVNPLTGLTVAAFYGCHITRPPLRYGFVDSRNNVALERLAEILGCRPIDYSGRTECCGFHTAAHDERVAIKLTGQHILSAKTGGAQAMVTPCPLCHTVLDGFQREIEKDMGQKLDMPVLHLPQLVGLALGLSPEELQHRPAHGGGGARSPRMPAVTMRAMNAARVTIVAARNRVRRHRRLCAAWSHQRASRQRIASRRSLIAKLPRAKPLARASDRVAS